MISVVSSTAAAAAFLIASEWPGQAPFASLIAPGLALHPAPVGRSFRHREAGTEAMVDLTVRPPETAAATAVSDRRTCRPVLLSMRSLKATEVALLRHVAAGRTNVQIGQSTYRSENDPQSVDHAVRKAGRKQSRRSRCHLHAHRRHLRRQLVDRDIRPVEVARACR